MKYDITKSECKKNIDKQWNVCNYCWRNLIPIKTVNNSWIKTYWIWCNHWTKWDNTRWHFTNWVSKEIYKLAKKLVLNNWICWCLKSSSDFNYSFYNAIKYACDRIQDIEYMKTHKSRYTISELKDDFDKFIKTK